MAAKNGKARVPSPSEQENLFSVIKKHRHPEKNTAIMQISFKLGLRVQEISLLQIKEVADLLPQSLSDPFKIHKVMSLPAAYTKGARNSSERKTVSFTVYEFNKLIENVASLAKAGAEIVPEKLYPERKKRKGKSRDLPMVDESLRDALHEHIHKRLLECPTLKPSDPLFVTQRGNAYSPNVLQEHMALMLRKWAGIEKASSHSGRRAVITDIIHNQNKPIKVAQQVAGHVDGATTLIYCEPGEVEVSDALSNIGSTK